MGVDVDYPPYAYEDNWQQMASNGQTPNLDSVSGVGVELMRAMASFCGTFTVDITQTDW